MYKFLKATTSVHGCKILIKKTHYKINKAKKS